MYQRQIIPYQNCTATGHNPCLLYTSAAALGIKGQTVDSSIAEAYGIPQGVYVAEVEKGSAAEKAGITSGSVITKFDGTSVKSMDDLKSCLLYTS